ncbi:MAG: SusD/RagB family nutrient-binding outer rane lipoprotein [Chitinophagaceae bacterium]|nr:SusD/RagB family nutrient-binding outer rane lipoprotein [Chitinophagaceae bacterium]
MFNVLAMVAILLSAGCKKINDFGDTNVNPNGTAVPSTAALLTNVLAGLGGLAAQTRPGLYAQQFSETQYTEVSLYALPQLEFDGNFAGGLMDLQNIININTDPATKDNATKFGANANQVATARIMKAYIFWTITDRWGDIPYFESLKGSANLSPKYDTQEAIYKDLVKELKESIAQFQPTGAKVQGDIIYGGDVTKWQKFANSLRMLIALRTSKVYPGANEFGATEFKAAFQDAQGYIASNADNFTIKYPGTVAAFSSPWWALYNGRTDYAESKLMTDLTASLSDPRQAAFGSSTTGFPYGLTRDQAVIFGTSYATILAAAKRDRSSPLVIIGASDVLLAIAEAAQRGWITANVAAFYQNGISENWAEWGVTGNLSGYLANTSVGLTGTASDLQKIQLQQYISFYPDGLQAWANWRRTGVPALTPTSNAINSSKQIPRRFTYGPNEYNLNSTSVKEAVARMGGGDTPEARVWWDK